MNDHYIAENRKELFDSSSAEIKNLIKGGEVTALAKTIGQTYKLPIGEFELLSNLISFVLIGALEPKNVVLALMEGLQLSEEEATKIASDLEKSIFEKARMITLGKSGDEVTKLEYKGERTPYKFEILTVPATRRKRCYPAICRSGISITNPTSTTGPPDHQRR